MQQKFINRLPLDIVLRIIPYTYTLQNKKLLFDIRNYIEMKNTLSELYYNCYMIEYPLINEPQNDKNWLINDIFSYANGYQATMWGYISRFYNILNRKNMHLQTEQELEDYVTQLEKKEVNTQINVLLGLFTPNERNDLIVNFHRITNGDYSIM